MPRFFFDVMDGRDLNRDEIGLELDDLDRVRSEAIDALPDIARAELPDGDRAEFAVYARDESGRVVFKATLNFTAEWC
jgi:hypothetical protein